MGEYIYIYFFCDHWDKDVKLVDFCLSVLQVTFNHHDGYEYLGAIHREVEHQLRSPKSSRAKFPNIRQNSNVSSFLLSHEWGCSTLFAWLHVTG